MITYIEAPRRKQREMRLLFSSKGYPGRSVIKDRNDIGWYIKKFRSFVSLPKSLPQKGGRIASIFTADNLIKN